MIQQSDNNVLRLPTSSSTSTCRAQQQQRIQSNSLSLLIQKGIVLILCLSLAALYTYWDKYSSSEISSVLSDSAHQLMVKADTTTPTTARDELQPTASHQSSSSFYIPSYAIETVLLETTTTPPFQWLVHHPKIDHLAERLIQNRGYEPDTIRFVEEAFPLDDNNYNDNNWIAVDIGANVGFHSLHMASRGAHVLSFEPAPDTRRLLMGSVHLNDFQLNFLHDNNNNNLNPSDFRLHTSSLKRTKGSVTVIPAAASDEDGTGRLTRHPASPGLTTLASTSFLGMKKAEEGSVLDVDIVLMKTDRAMAQYGLDAANIESYKSRLRLIKVDAEGYELRAFRGLDLTKYPFQYLTIEFFPKLIQECGSDPMELLLYILVVKLL